MLPGQQESNGPYAWTKENFLEPDNDTNILLEGGVIKAATFPKLVSKLTYDYPDPALLKEFLLTHRSFTKDGLELMAALKTRYESAEEATGSVEEAAVIKFKTLNVLKNWLEHFIWDFALDCPDIVSLCSEWLDTIHETETGPLSKTASSLKSKMEYALQTKDQKKAKVIPTEEAPKPYLPKEPLTSVLDCNTEEIVRQMTLVEWKYWSSIHPFEFLNLSWTKSDKEYRAPNIIMSINHFNYVSAWVTNTICDCPKIKDRVKVIVRWIDIANRLQAIGNLNGMMEVLSGLSKGPVYRLKLTFAHLQAKEPKAFATFENLMLHTRPNNAYAGLRKMLLSKNPPVIPYLGMYLTDLTFMEEGNKDNVTDHKLVNFYKRRLLCNTLNDIQNYQHLGYNYIEIPTMAWAIMYGPENKTEEELYEISLVLEPRAQKFEKSQKSSRSGSLSFPKRLLSLGSNHSESSSSSVGDSPKNLPVERTVGFRDDIKCGSLPAPGLTSSASTPELRKSKSFKDRFTSSEDGSSRVRLSSSRRAANNIDNENETAKSEVSV